MIDPSASFDALEILATVGERSGPLAEAEIHLFAYLSCLLSIFEGAPVSLWGYEFASTGSGSPYSEELSRALLSMARTGQVALSNNLFVLTPRGREFLSQVSELRDLLTRRRFLEAATSSVLTMSFGQFRYALMQEPGLRSARVAEYPRLLASGSSLEVLHDQFRVLSDAIGIQVRDLLVPAVVWLTFLAQTRKRAELRAEAEENAIE
jgi:hypothetical protein